MLSPDLMLDSGPPPQAVLDKRWLWKILLALLGLTLLLRLLGLDVAGAILSALMLWFAVVMTRDGMAEVGKYSFIYGVLCALNFFFDLLPLITELGGRVTRTRQAVGTGMTPDGGKQTTYTLTTKTTPFFDSAEGFVYNVQSVAMIVAPIAMALGLHLSMSAHNEFARLMPSSDDDWDNGEGALLGSSTQTLGPQTGLRRQENGSGAGSSQIRSSSTGRNTYERFQGQGYKL